MGIIKFDDNTFRIVNTIEDISLPDLQTEANQLVVELSGLELNPPTSTELRDFALTQHPHYQRIDEINQRLIYLNSLISRLNNLIDTYTE